MTTFADVSLPIQHPLNQFYFLLGSDSDKTNDAFAATEEELCDLSEMESGGVDGQFSRQSIMTYESKKTVDLMATSSNHSSPPTTRLLADDEISVDYTNNTSPTRLMVNNEMDAEYPKRTSPVKREDDKVSDWTKQEEDTRRWPKIKKSKRETNQFDDHEEMEDDTNSKNGREQFQGSQLYSNSPKPLVSPASDRFLSRQTSPQIFSRQKLSPFKSDVEDSSSLGVRSLSSEPQSEYSDNSEPPHSNSLFGITSHHPSQLPNPLRRTPNQNSLTRNSPEPLLNLFQPSGSETKKTELKTNEDVSVRRRHTVSDKKKNPVERKRLFSDNSDRHAIDQESYAPNINNNNKLRPNFVHKLESFVASVEKRAKMSQPMSAAFINPILVGKNNHENHVISKYKNSLSASSWKQFKPESKNLIASSNKSYFSTNGQPLDLSLKSTAIPSSKMNKRTDTQKSGQVRPVYVTPDSPDNVAVNTGMSKMQSSLANLEKKFGENSQIFDRIGATALKAKRTSQIGFDTSLYGLALHEVSDQFVTTAAAAGSVKDYAMPQPAPAPSLLERQYFHSLYSARPWFKDRRGIGEVEEKRDSQQKINTLSTRIEPPSGRLPIGSAKSESTETVHSQPELHGAVATISGEKKRPSCSSLRCSCDAEFDSLYALAMHLQTFRHVPASCNSQHEQIMNRVVSGVGGGGNGVRSGGTAGVKLVRGQYVWLHRGSEQTRQIMRCIECNKSFR